MKIIFDLIDEGIMVCRNKAKCSKTDFYSSRFLVLATRIDFIQTEDCLVELNKIQNPVFMFVGLSVVL